MNDKRFDELISKLRNVCERGSNNPDIFALEFPKLFDELSELPLYNDVDNLMKTEIDLVHYTSWSNTLDIFKKNQSKDNESDRTDNQRFPVLRMYNYEHSNDPYEGKIKPLKWRKIENDLVNFAKSLNTSWIKIFNPTMSTYGCSFSSGSSGIEDDLTYWRLYGNDGRGCSLKISKSFVRYPYRVRYRDNDFKKWSKQDKEEEEEVAEHLIKVFTACKEIVHEVHENYKLFVGRLVVEVMFRIIHSYYHLIKHITYRGEKEWRTIRVMPKPNEVWFDIASKHNVKRYVEGTRLSELLSSASVITIGPTVPNQGAARAYLEYMVKEYHKIQNVVVENSKQIYRQVPLPSS